ncbi:MAG: tetraacyldisaccharide 4'-kinase [Elusimicrobia bacterium]|nr:tetraacyldisaccharide 4'-kinase [Elusimicrobiota bacterium]
MNSPEQIRTRLRAAWWGRALLIASSWAYALVMLGRRYLYQWRILPSKRLSARTVCIGNLTTGGTGKTSAVLLAADTLHKNQVKVAILSRGYNRPQPTRDVQVLLDGRDTTWEQAGDEPWMMHQILKGMEIPILVCPDRYRAGLEAVHYYQPQVLLLDDGFQHHRLRRDLDILLINATDPFGGGRVLPAGNLREPISGAARARVIVLTQSDRVSKEKLEEARAAFHKINPRAKILEAVHRPSVLLDLRTEHKRRLSHLKDKQISCLSALGDPKSFEEQLSKSGAQVLQAWRFPDHHQFTIDEIRSIESVRNGIPLVTTFKDAPRLPLNWREVLTGEVLALGVRLEITQGKDIWEAELCKGVRHA